MIALRRPPSGRAALPLSLALALLAAPLAPLLAQDAAAPPEDRAGALGIVLVAIPGGEFTMGSRSGPGDERPVHDVVVSPFRMGRTEVTVGQFRRFADVTGFVTDAERARQSSWRSTGFFQAEEHPAVNVSWNDAAAFCAWAGLRLPTEAEWEYAAGNGATHTTYSWGSVAPSSPVGNVGDETARWYLGPSSVFPSYNDGHLFTAPVASYPESAFGLHDMTGNVEEWCADWYDASWYAVSPAQDPKGPETGRFRVFRGGSWDSTVGRANVTRRGRYAPGARAAHIGFRVAAGD